MSSCFPVSESQVCLFRNECGEGVDGVWLLYADWIRVGQEDQAEVTEVVEFEWWENDMTWTHREQWKEAGL